MQLRVVFPPPGFFLTDARVIVSLGDRVVYDGGFKQGFDVTVDAPSGRQTLEAAIHLTATLARKRKYEIEIPDGEGVHGLQLVYSRFWGNFEKRPKVLPG